MAAAPCGIDVDQDVDPLLQIAHDRLAQRCRNTFRARSACSRILRAFDARAKIGFGKKVIILAIDLAGARRASRAGNGVNEIGRLAERVTERRFARAGGSGDDEKNSVAAELPYSRFWICSRIFSTSDLQATTWREISASPAFAPNVFSSREIS